MANIFGSQFHLMSNVGRENMSGKKIELFVEIDIAVKSRLSSVITVYGILSLSSQLGSGLFIITSMKKAIQI